MTKNQDMMSGLLQSGCELISPSRDEEVFLEFAKRNPVIDYFILLER